jgi:hypothetical protein
MFRCILYVKLASHSTGEMGYPMTTGAFPTWDAANEIIEEWYASKCRSGKYEVCGGTIEQKIEGVGWCVCETKPEEPFVEDDVVVVLGPTAAWSNDVATPDMEESLKWPKI